MDFLNSYFEELGWTSADTKSGINNTSDNECPAFFFGEEDIRTELANDWRKTNDANNEKVLSKTQYEENYHRLSREENPEFFNQ